MAPVVSMWAIVANVLFLAGSLGDNSFFLKPNKTGTQIALMIIQGAECPPAGYRLFAEAVQRASSFALWVGVPEYVANTPEPVQFGPKLKSVLKSMAAAGMNANRTVLVAHSLGGVMSQQYVSSGRQGLDGLILYGSTLLRTYRHSPLPLPTLTIDGDLDGLLRVSRQAEAFHHQVSNQTAPRDPVAILSGLSHWSISSGTPPSNVRKHDLRPEATESDGHAAIAALVSAYLDSKFGEGAAQASGTVAVGAAVANTSTLLAPLLAAMRLEGSKHLTTPCDSDYPTNPTCNYPQYPDKSLGPRKKPPNPLPPADCVCGSPWMATAALMMADLEHSAAAARATLVTADAFHDVSDVRPFHLPHIFHPRPGTACDNATGAPACVINLTTLTQPVYDSRDALDTGLYPTSATELRGKLKSRQAVRQSAGLAATDFDALDKRNTSICRAINEAAWAWALKTASPTARARFERLGQPLTFGQDVLEGIGITGPKWIHAPLTFTPSADKRNVSVGAPYFATENKDLGDKPYTSAVGYHYCKLLSPARAMEWLYVDGLLAFGGINPSAAGVVEETSAARANDAAGEAAAAPQLAMHAAPGPCCVRCDPPLAKYFSVDVKGGFCGECCMLPSKYPIYKIFEANLTRANDSTPCAEQFTPHGGHYINYTSTVTHGIPGLLSITLDLYGPVDPSLSPASAGSSAEELGVEELEAEELEAAPSQSTSGCPALAPLRSAHVNGTSFAPTELSGFWYEAAYIDVAQIGATCQTLNFTVGGGASGGGLGLSAKFRVKYGPLPFTITEVYKPSGFQGGYSKHAAMPGGQLLVLPTVVVDVTPKTLILFSCVSVPFVGHVSELVVATRSASPAPDAISQQLALAQELGVPFTKGDVKWSNHSLRC